MIRFLSKARTVHGNGSGVSIAACQDQVEMIKEPCISFVKLKEPVCFHHPCNDPVWVVFALGGVSDDGHIELLQDLSSLLAGDQMIEKLAALNTYEELEKLMEKEARR